MNAPLARRAERAQRGLDRMGEKWVPDRCDARHRSDGFMFRTGDQPEGGEWIPCRVCEGQIRVWSPGALGGTSPLSDRQLVERWEEKKQLGG